jgi:hypothetical protein
VERTTTRNSLTTGPTATGSVRCASTTSALAGCRTRTGAGRAGAQATGRTAGSGVQHDNVTGLATFLIWRRLYGAEAGFRCCLTTMPVPRGQTPALGAHRPSQPPGQRQRADRLARCTWPLLEGTTTVIDDPDLDHRAQGSVLMRYPRSYRHWLSAPGAPGLAVRADSFLASRRACGGSEPVSGSAAGRRTRARHADRILAHLFLMCGQDAALTHDLTCWLAWPLQHPGRRSGYAYVVHGGQGTGKSMFFEQLMMKIYGPEHSIQIGQNELEVQVHGLAVQEAVRGVQRGLQRSPTSARRPKTS